MRFVNKMTVVHLLVVFLSLTESFALKDVTSDIFKDGNKGIIAAFGDFDADKLVDIFIISADGSSVSAQLAGEKVFSETPLLVNVTSGDESITGVVPADFDGDQQMDILLTLRNASSGKVAVRIYWCQQRRGCNKGNPLQLPDMVDQPLLLDENGDMIPDLFGEKAPGERYFWLFSKHRNFTEKRQDGGTAELRVPQSSAFVDLNNDLTADLCVVSKNGSQQQLEKWINVDGVLTLQSEEIISVNYKDKELKVIGQFLFVDTDANLAVDILVPVCTDNECEESFILQYRASDKSWVKLPVNLHHGSVLWNFIPPSKTAGPANIDVPITLRTGDFNLDGFPDLVAVLGNATGNLHRAVILKNVHCSSDCEGFTRTFSVDWDIWLEGAEDKALLPAFYDLGDNGILDVLVNSVAPNDVPKFQMSRHDFVDDACFVKVTVVSGLCNYDCPNGRQPYGVNQPGPVARYEMSDVAENVQHAAATQLSQSAYQALQLPYHVFGLGQTPNFINTLEVGIPTNSKTKSLSKAWKSVIPNSQLVIIPYPINDPSRWSNKLFVTPSRLMLLTGASLLGTCGFIAGIIAILHWRDRIEDRKEKKQEAQKFHFDAM